MVLTKNGLIHVGLMSIKQINKERQPLNVGLYTINALILNTQMPPVIQIQMFIRTVHTVIKTIANLGIRNTLVSIAGKFVIWTCSIRFGYTTR